MLGRRGGESKERKVRSDKKREVKPTVSTYVRDNLFEISRLSGIPVKDVALLLIHRAFQSDEVMRLIQPKMISNFTIGNRIYVGNREPYPFKVEYKGDTSKITIKFPQELFEKLRELAFAVGTTPTTICAVLIRRAMFNPEFMEEHKTVYRKHSQFPQHIEELYTFIENIYSTIPKEKKEDAKRWKFFG